MASALLVCLIPAPAAGRDGASVDPSVVRIGFLYSGQDVTLATTKAGPGDVVFRVHGPERPVDLKRKGRKFGFLWMNVGEVRYESVPVLYIVRSSRAIEEIATPAVLDDLGIGCDALRVSLGTEPGDGGEDVFEEFIKLKRSEDMYSCEGGGISRSETDGGPVWSTDVSIPPRAPVGDYTVDFFGFEDGEGRLLSTRRIQLVRGSGVSFVMGLLEAHGLLYGCLAVTIALLAGLGTGLIFGMRRGGGH